MLHVQMLKKAAFALTLAVFTVQTVGWVECCCILICKHQNDPCQDECKDQPQKPQAAAADCCEKPAATSSGTPDHRHDQRCSHVQPSSEVDTQTAAAPIDVPLLALELSHPELPLPAGRATELPTQAARGSPPLLHLLYGALLI